MSNSVPNSVPRLPLISLLCLFMAAITPAIVAIIIVAAPVRGQSSQLQLYHITFTGQAELQALATQLDIWEVNHANHTILTPLTAEDVAVLGQSHTLTLALDQSPLSPDKITTAQTSGIPGFPCYRTVDETFATLDQLAATYPNLVAQRDIGDSWDKEQAGGPMGDDLRVVVLTNQATPGPKFRFFLMGAIHAREYATTELALRFAESLLQRYGSDADATWLLDHGELHLLPVANPDGRRLADSGLLWRKNTNSVDAACANVNVPNRTYGVDLNRNSTFKWNECDGFTCSSAVSCQETYRGVAPASEPEVAAIEAYLRSIFVDQRGDDLTDSAPQSTEGIFISLHAYGQLVLFPWGYTTTHAPNAAGLATIARRLGFPFNYTVCQAGGAGCLYQTDGTTDDFAYGELGVASFTIELGTAFFQSCSTFENSMLQAGLTALDYAFHAAPRPYELAQGPQILDLAISPATMPDGHVTLSATVDARRIAPLSGTGVGPITEPIDNIRALRMTVDALPWQGLPLPHPVTAVDGSFDSTVEAVTASVEVACLESGRHSLYLQAQDDQGDWGIASAEFVTVTNTSPLALTLQTVSTQVTRGEPVSYTVTLTNSAATSATFTLEALTPSTGEGAAQVSLPDQPVTLAAGATLEFTTVITPLQKITASTTLPAVIIARSIVDPTHCRQLQIATIVQPWAYQQRLILIGKY